MFMPLDFLLRLLSSVVSIAILGGGAYIFYQWRQGQLISNLWLYFSIGLLVWSFLGFLLILLLHRPGHDEPKPYRSERVQRLKRPDGSEINIEIYGPDDAPTLILSHGWGPDSTVWYYAKKQLSDQLRVVVWDLPGLGKSRKPQNRDYSLEKFAADLNAVLEAVENHQPVTLLGHSMGAMILLTFCRLFPEQLGHPVKGLILVDGTYTNPLKTTTLSKLLLTLQKPLLEPLLHLAIALSPILHLITWLSYFNGTTLLTTEISGFTGRETRGQLNFSSLIGIKAPPGVLARGVLAMFKFEETATLPEITVSTLVMVGKTDIATRPFASERMSTAIPQAELSVIAPGGHMALMERNQQFSDKVRSFIQSCSSLNSTSRL